MDQSDNVKQERSHEGRGGRARLWWHVGAVVADERVRRHRWACDRTRSRWHRHPRLPSF